MDFKEQISALWRGERSPSAIGSKLGFELVEFNDGSALFTMLVDQQHWSFLNIVQGGVLTAIAEAAMGVAFATTLSEGEHFTMTELHIHYLHPIREGRVDAQARVIERRRTIGLVECELRNEEKKLLAKVSATCMALRIKESTSEEQLDRSMG